MPGQKRTYHVNGTERHAIRHLSVTDSLRKISSCQKATTGPQIKRTNLYSLEKLWNGKGKRKRPLISQFFFKKKKTPFSGLPAARARRVKHAKNQSFLTADHRHFGIQCSTREQP